MTRRTAHRRAPPRHATRAAGVAALFAALVLPAAPGRTQDNPPAPPGTIAPPGSQAANPKSPGAATPDSPGAGLHAPTGVIQPPAGVDPGIAAPPPVPAPGAAGTVIRPPGTPGGDPTVQPK